MPFTLSADEQAIRKMVREFAQTRATQPAPMKSSQTTSQLACEPNIKFRTAF